MVYKVNFRASPVYCNYNELVSWVIDVIINLIKVDSFMFYGQHPNTRKQKHKSNKTKTDQSQAEHDQTKQQTCRTD